MAGFVKRNSAQRWNRAASIVEAAGAGSHFVRGVYRQPIRGNVCDELAPGSYPAVAGASIAAGATGVVVYDGGVYSAVNQSQCPVSIGDKVGLHVSPDCQAFFVPCVCNCSGSGPADCCDKFVAICVGGYTQVVPVDCEDGDPWTATQTWSLFPLRQCCEAYNDDLCSTPSTINIAYLGIKLCCTGNTITAYYGTTCGIFPEETSPGSGTWDWSGLCDDPPVQMEEDVVFSSDEGNVCAIKVVASATTSANLCEPCSEPPPPSLCCSQSLWFCLNGDSQQLAVNGGTYTWNVTDCCTCTAATFEVTLSCNEDTDVITLQYEFDCDGVIQTGSENTLMSTFCTSQAPQIITFLGLTCFLQLLVTIVQFDCATCEPTATTPPPP